ncbi:MAG: tol-pal system YbgF family protein [Nitrospirales bacterium]
MTNLMPSSAQSKFLITILSLTLFLSGCFKAPSPEVELQELRAQAEERLLQDAKLAFIRADYPEAVLLFNRFVNNHRKSTLALEAQWWLARSYQQSGNLRLALARFQRLAQSSKRHLYRQEARFRAQNLIEVLGLDPVSSHIKGLSVKFQYLPLEAEAYPGIAHTRLRKGAVLLVDLGCPVHRPSFPHSDGPESEGQNWQNELGQDLDTVIEAAFHAGEAVYLGVSLPCLGLFAPESVGEIPQLHDWSFDPQSQRVGISPYFSLFSSGYQTALQDMLSKLSQSKIAGIVFQEDVPLGLRDGLSPIAIKKFERAFDITLNPATLFLRGKPVRTSQREAEDIRDRPMATYPDMFWKWAGWKSRERLRVMNELVHTIRVQFPHLQFGVEIHPESIHDPVYALAHFSEDWVEMAQAPFDFFVVRFPDLSHPGFQTPSRRWSQSNPRMFQQDVIQRMVDYLEDPQKVWVIQPEQRAHSDLGSVLNHGEAEPMDWPEGVGEIMEISTGP